MPNTEAIKPFRLMDLPSELRRDIFKLSLKEQNGIQIWLTEAPRMTELPALTQVSVQVRKETMDLFYSQNEFHFVAKSVFTGSDCEKFKASLRLWTQHANSQDMEALQAISIAFCSNCYFRRNEPICPFKSFEDFQEWKSLQPGTLSLSPGVQRALNRVSYEARCKERGRTCRRIINFTLGRDNKLHIYAGGQGRSFRGGTRTRVVDFVDSLEHDSNGEHQKPAVLLEAVLKSTHLWIVDQLPFTYDRARD